MKTLISSRGLGIYVSLVLFCGNFWNQPVHNKKTIKGTSCVDSTCTVEALLSGHLRGLPKCPFNRGCPLINSAKFVND